VRRRLLRQAQAGGMGVDAALDLALLQKLQGCAIEGKRSRFTHQMGGEA
jgi:hypothetical protein